MFFFSDKTDKFGILASVKYLTKSTSDYRAEKGDYCYASKQPEFQFDKFYSLKKRDKLATLTHVPV